MTPVRVAATAAAALPAVGLGVLCLREGFAEIRNPSLNCAFHIVLGAALLVLFADVAYVIHASEDLGLILLTGVLGFVGAFTALFAAELGGPMVLLLLALAATVWSVAIARRTRRARGR